ncbi:MAG: HAMP domain-containing protein [Myxococcales bacterium]|nr:MAG: HAMP domain-containing protein [Myxococcales bacterium]
MLHHYTRLGLRAQIMIVLCVAFAGSFLLIGVAAGPLMEHVRSVDRMRAASANARVLAAMIDDGHDIQKQQSWRDILAALSHGSGLVAARIDAAGKTTFVWGSPERGQAVRAPLREGGEVRLWVKRPDNAVHQSAGRLLIPYVIVAGGFMLLLTFVALTYGIVRPVERLTRASQRLTMGGAYEAVPVQGVAEIAHLAAVYNNMAQQLRAEREALVDRVRRLEETTKKLKEAQRDLVRSEKLASVGRLAAGVAHEIGNPLAAILGFVQLIQAGRLSKEENKEFLDRIQRETERINKIIRGLLDFSRQGPSPKASESRSNLSEVIEHAVRLVTPQKDMSNVTIERRIVEGTPHVKGDADELTQVLLNLLLNAADAIDGEGSIQIELSALPNRNMVLLAVTDSGPGIDPKIAEKLFDPFVTTKDVGGGTGLGLAVCHNIVESLGGSISAGAAAHGGARFEMRLPAVDS